MARILFIADHHYNSFPGRYLAPAFDGYEVRFFQDNFSELSSPSLVDDYDLLVLNCISETCNNEPLGADAEVQVKAWVQAGKPILLLHGSSAAFWQWQWWRKMVGWRWVRPNDPDGIDASTHPVRPFNVVRAKTGHPLAAELRELNLPTDEIYINLQQVCPAWTLLETTTDEGTFPMAHIHQLPQGSLIGAFLPGHDKAVTSHPDVHFNVRRMADWLLAPAAA